MKKVLLLGGFGNRLNNILNFIEEDVEYIWVDGECRCKWEDIFQYPKINIKYGDKHEWCNYHYFFKGMKDSRRASAINFINSLIPVPYVYLKMNEVCIDRLPAYYVRALHPKTKVNKIIHVPDGYYLSTDSREQRIANPQAIQINTIGGKRDYDRNIRSGDGVRDSIADWLNLMKCEKIYEFAFPFSSMAENHSTFIDAHRILGMDIIQMTSK